MRDVSETELPVPCMEKAKLSINENLTQARKRLLWQSKQAAKENGYAFVRTMNGKIYVRKNDNSHPNVIVTEKDLKNFDSVNKVTNFVYFCFCFYSEMTTDTYTERKYPWGNQEKSICAKYLGVDDMIAHSSFSSLNGIIICHLNVVSLVKNINKVEDFLNEFIRKPDVICSSKTKLKNKNLQYTVTLSGHNFFCNNSVTNRIVAEKILLKTILLKTKQNQKNQFCYNNSVIKTYNIQ